MSRAYTTFEQPYDALAVHEAVYFNRRNAQQLFIFLENLGIISEYMYKAMDREIMEILYEKRQLGLYD